MCGQDRNLPELLHTDPDGVNVPANTWAGTAATLLSSGRTIHNLFKLPIPILYTSTCSVSSNLKHADYLRSVTLFTMDEALVVPFHVLNALVITYDIYDDVKGYHTPECALRWQSFSCWWSLLTSAASRSTEALNSHC